MSTIKYTQTYAVVECECGYYTSFVFETDCYGLNLTKHTEKCDGCGKVIQGSVNIAVNIETIEGGVTCLD
ncbi:hypothetical protein QNI19_14695 [Cytophagaceae bacterium DM2B3-1]|uniref:Uncharacterized protein n=1 Tax=Xanthocytophaga flava TaxID=3048013 RepID=A0ABT7CKC8_9BACT|nr:hypothetical protein [Xanthocytophaga flavus]MDJ1494189.1 hypothetical protein [Xanthocytophaga flavus]